MRAKLYSEKMTTKTYEHLVESALAELEQGSNVILDATFSRLAQRESLKMRLSRAGVGLCFVELEAADALVRKRLADRSRAGNGKEISDARLDNFEALTARYQPPMELGAGERVVVRTQGSAEATLEEALKALVQLNLETGGRDYE